MLAPLVFVLAVLAALTGALLESGARTARVADAAALTSLSDAAIAASVADVTGALGDFVARHGTAGPWPRGTSRSAARSACAAAPTCPAQYVTSATITDASADAGEPGPADARATATNLQSAAIDEQRVAAIVTATLSTASGTVVATRTRLVTYRVFAAPPYALVAGTRDVATVGTPARTAPGDTGGQVAGDDTRIHVRLTCSTVTPNVVPFHNDQNPAGNDGLPWGNAAGNAYEAPCATPDEPVDAFHDERWNNGDAPATGWSP